MMQWTGGASEKNGLRSFARGTLLSGKNRRRLLSNHAATRGRFCLLFARCGNSVYLRKVAFTDRRTILRCLSDLSYCFTGVVKREMENRLGPKKSRFRILFLEKARITHEMRCVFQRATNVTRNRLDILKDVVRLSVSRYKEVRSTAQTVFAEVVNQLHLTYRYALDDILGYLATSKSRTDDNDAQLKGSLHLLLGSKNSSYILKYDWETLRRVFPAIVEAQHSENPTVSRLFDSINEKCETMFVTTGLIITPCPGANKVAAQILGAGNGELEVIFDHALKLSAQKLELRNAQNTQLYLELVEHLVRLLNTPQIRLKNYLIGQVFLSYFSK